MINHRRTVIRTMRSALFLAFILALATGQDVNWGKKVKCFVVQGEVICPGCNQRAGLSCPRRRKDGMVFESCLPPTRTDLPPTPKHDLVAPTAKSAVSKVEVIPTSEATTELFHSKSTEAELLRPSEPSLSDGQIESRNKESWEKPEMIMPNITKADSYTMSNEIAPMPLSSTKEPVSSTKEPVSSTKEPVSTTKEPVSTTKESQQYEVTQDTIDWDLMLYLYRVYGSPPKARRWPRSAKDTLNEDDDLETCTWNGDCPCPLICCNRGEGCPGKCVSGIRLPPPWG